MLKFRGDTVQLESVSKLIIYIHITLFYYTQGVFDGYHLLRSENDRIEQDST